MKKHTFNGFEGYLLQEALKLYIEKAEKEVAAATEAAKQTGKNPIFAPGYFRLVGGELRDKVQGMTQPSK